MTLLKKIEEYIENIKANPFYTPTDNIVRDDIIQILHDYYNSNLLTSFLVIEQLNKEKLQKEKQLLYRGLEDGMHNLVNISKCLLEGKTSKAKTNAKMYFIEDNLAYIIGIAKAYFPNGDCKGASNNGKWFFETFKNLLIKNKCKYLKGGDSYNWAIHNEYIDYINLILTKS